MPQRQLIIQGAREHNLKNIDVSIPRDSFVVITGLSGSGKSSLAFDTIYAEGQRRYVESLSAYARQFLGLMEKPDVEYIEGLSPAISIDQRGASRNPRSTVGTVTEIYDYLRLLYARVGIPHCPRCGREISRQTVSQIVDSVLSLPEDSRIIILAPLIKDRKGEHAAVLEDIQKSGFVRARIDGEIRELSESISLERYKRHSIEAVIDRLILRRDEGDDGSSSRSRLADSIETALKLGGGQVMILVIGGQELLFSQEFACVRCGISLGEIEPRTFSFNSPHGACPACDGLGTQMELDPYLIVSNPELSLAEGVIRPWSRASTGDSYLSQLLEAVADRYSFSMETPFRELTEAQQKVLLYGTQAETVTVRRHTKQGEWIQYNTTYEGVIPNLGRRYRETESDYIRSEIDRYMATHPCPICKGDRLKPESLAVTVADQNIIELTRHPVAELLPIFNALPELLSERQNLIASQILKEIKARLGFMRDVGLDYISLDRATATLSGGEAQRIRLATQIGSQLVGVLYILDEPSIGLHQRDNARLLDTLMHLRDLGNTLLVVEHDEATIRAADWVVDLGPGAGEHGGYVVASGPPEAIMECSQSITGQYLKGERRIPVPARRRSGNGQELALRGAREHNLKGIDVRFPLGKFVCITGVSGSGKSTLVIEILYKRLTQVLHRAREKAGLHEGIDGIELLDKVINIDQSPLGRTPRSNPVTYTNVFTPIRELFASLPEARMRGYRLGRFSFNVKGGRCEACQGQGTVKIEMQFLPDIYVPCEVCKGRRYDRETLHIRYRGKNIAEVLDLTVEEAVEFFHNIPKIRQKLDTLENVGLGYIRLGQPATTLSGGEAQRVKLSKELSRRATGRTLYMLDEPTTGLHFADIEKLLGVLNQLVDAGNTVLVIEHHLDVIKTADWVIDLGPEGGDLGGEVVAEGTPEEVAEQPQSYTGQFLRRVLPGFS